MGKPATRRLHDFGGALLCTLTVLLLATPGAASAASGGPEPPPSVLDGSLPAPPASAAAAVVGGLGLTVYRDTFSGLQVDDANGRLTVHATNEVRAQSMVGVARTRMPKALAGGVRIDIRKSRYTRAQLEAARTSAWRIAKSSGGPTLYSIAVPSNGSGLEVTSDDPERAAQLLRSRGTLGVGVSAHDVVVRPGTPVDHLSRANDSAPYYGGALLLGQRGQACTSAFGVRFNASGIKVLITADHCFDMGEDVRDGGGRVVEDAVGEVVREDVLTDAAGIHTDVAPLVFVNGETTRVWGGHAWSWNGQHVCQSGFFSNNVCEIQVIHDNVQVTSGGVVHWGVVGQRCEGCIVVRRGDSGGPVWATSSSGVFESRGVNSAGITRIGDPLTTGGYQQLFWTETERILSAFQASFLIG